MTAIENARQSLLILLPEMMILLSAIVMMTLGAFVKLPRRAWVLASAATLGVALFLLVALRVQLTDPYAAPDLNDAFSGYGRLVFLLGGLIVLAMAHDQVDEGRAPEFFGMLLLINAGSMLVAASNELIFLFVGLELVSIPTYLLLYLSRRDSASQEAATKYFFLSIFSSGLLLFGFAYLYGMAGVTNLKSLAYLAQVPSTMPNVPHPILGLVAVVFVMAGLGFRVAAVPFHFYAPDVYQGSPTIIAALLAWVPKGVGFLALLRTLTAVIPSDVVPPDDTLTQQAAVLAWLIAVVTMTLGNTVALAQTNLKRLFAYSSIAHAGYLMIGVAVAFRNGPRTAGIMLGSEAILYYLVAYGLMTLGAFAVIIGLSSAERPVETVDDLAGLAKAHPVMALAMAICLFSLAGIPILPGFWGKLRIFMAAFSASSRDDAPMYHWLALIGAINSAIGAYYYLKIVVAMYFREPVGKPLAPALTWPTATAIGACTILTAFMGFWSGPFDRGAREAAVALVAHPDPLAVRFTTAARTPEEMAEDARREAEKTAQDDRLLKSLKWATPRPRPAANRP